LTIKKPVTTTGFFYWREGRAAQVPGDRAVLQIEASGGKQKQTSPDDAASQICGFEKPVAIRTRIERMKGNKDG
jgi:hypothetical protein